MSTKKVSDPGYTFPNIPKQWTVEEQRFARGLRDLFDRLFPKTEPYKPSVSGLINISENEIQFVFPDDLVIFGGNASSAGGMTDISFVIENLVINGGDAEESET